MGTWPDRDQATPIFGTTDALLIRGVADLLRQRLGGREPPALRQLTRRDAPGSDPTS